MSASAQEYSGREKLRAQSNEFRKEVIRVTDGVYVAVGYSASNVVLIQGDGDTAEYWDTPGGRIATAISFAKAKLTGHRYDGGENETVSLT